MWLQVKCKICLAHECNIPAIKLSKEARDTNINCRRNSCVYSLYLTF